MCIRASVCQHFFMLSVCVSVFICGFCVSLPQFYLSLAAGDPESSEHMIRGWWVMVGDLLKLFGGWWSEVSAAHLPLSFPALSHPVIRVTVRSCLAPIGHANNSFNNPDSCNISLLFGSPCHAKNPEMEKQLHRCWNEPPSMWWICVFVWQTDHDVNSTLCFSLDLFVRVRSIHMCARVNHWTAMLASAWLSLLTRPLCSFMCLHVFLRNGWTERLHANLLRFVMCC